MSLNTVINVGKRQADLNYIYQSNLDPKNRFIDVEFSRSVWGNFDRNVGISSTAFTVNLTQNGGAVTLVNILSVKQIDSEIEAEASALTGGEMFARVFIDINAYPTNVEEINLQLVKDNIYDIQGIKLIGQTGNIKLSPLPYAIMGNDYLWWDASEGAITEGIIDKSVYRNHGIAEAGYETTIGNDIDGDFIQFNESSLILQNQDPFDRFSNDYLVFAIHKFEGNIASPAEQGNIIDIVSARTIICYPFGTLTAYGAINTGSPNSNVLTANGTLTNNKEVLRYNYQSDKTLEVFKNGVSQDTAGTYTPFRLFGGGRVGSNNATPTSQNYLGKQYHLVFIKGNYSLSEINALQTYFETL